MRRPHLRTFSRDAFTLIELLVSLGVIAVLAILLLTDATTVHASFQTTKCIANLKTIGTAMQGYMAENNGYAPPHYTIPFHNLDWTRARWNWMTWLSPYLLHDTSGSQAPMPSVFDCPADPKVKTWPKPRPYFPASPTGSDHSLGSYGYNYVNLTTSASWVAQGGPPPNAPTIKNVTRLILVADGRKEGGDAICVNYTQEAARPALRHGKGFNAVFLDGHVATMPKEAASDSKYWRPE